MFKLELESQVDPKISNIIVLSFVGICGYHMSRGHEWHIDLTPYNSLTPYQASLASANIIAINPTLQKNP